MSDKSDHDLLIEIHGRLMGTDGQGGLCRQVNNNTKQINRIWIAITLISATVGGSAWGIISKLLGG